MTQNADPSPEQIAAACREIRAGWSPEETLRRLRSDLRPTYRRADGQRETFVADDYETHHERREKLQEVLTDG
jgi:hypothetical protein